MGKPTPIEIYEQHIRGLPPTERLRLLSLIAGDLADEAELPDDAKLHDVMEFHGAGRQSWDGSDAQQFVNELRVSRSARMFEAIRSSDRVSNSRK